MMNYKGSREAAVAAIVDLAPEHPEYVFVSADSMAAARATKFAELFPERFIEVGIAEQCGVDVCAGIAAAGYVPFMATYAGFISMRACEQVRTFVAYPNLNAKFIGLNAGLVGGEREGVTHQFYEDIGIFRSIPNMTIVSPCDEKQAYLATQAVAQVQGPCYIRVGSGKESFHLGDDVPPFELGKARVLRQYGNDVVVFCHGLVMGEAISAIEQLEEQGIHGTLVEVHTIAPLDTQAIVDALKECKAAITLEDHNINGGLGSAVSEVIAEYGLAVRLARMGLTTFGESGVPEDLLRAYHLDAASVVDKAKSLI